MKTEVTMKAVFSSDDSSIDDGDDSYGAENVLSEDDTADDAETTGAAEHVEEAADDAEMPNSAERIEEAATLERP